MAKDVGGFLKMTLKILLQTLAPGPQSSFRLLVQLTKGKCFKLLPATVSI